MIGGWDNVGHGGHCPGKCRWEVRRGSLLPQQEPVCPDPDMKEEGPACMYAEQGATPLGQVEPRVLLCQSEMRVQL